LADVQSLFTFAALRRNSELGASCDEEIPMIRHALRLFRKSPGFTLSAVAALTLGIGANTAIFSVINAVLLKPLAFPDADRIVILGTHGPQGDNRGGSPAKFQHWRAQTDVLRDVSAFRTNVVNYTGGGVPEQFQAAQVSADYFHLFGVPVLRGRTFTAAEDRPGGERVVVLSRATWVRIFASRDDVLGRPISLSGEPYTIVGIADAPAALAEIDRIPDVWIPFQLDPNTSDQGHYFRVAGRLAPGITFEQATTRLGASTAGYRQTFPTALQNGETFVPTPLADAIAGGVRSTLLVLAGAVGFVLLIACANVANLLLARAAGRKREIAIRAAIGASRWRIVRQLLVESLLLATAGGVLGLGVGLIGIRGLLLVNTAGLPRIGDTGAGVTLDWRVLVFTVGVSILTGVIFGLVPALSASRADLGVVLKESSSRSGTGTRQQRTRSLLVIAETALALILLVGAALLVRTAVALRAVDPGFDAENVLTLRMSLADARFATSESVEQMVRTGVERIRTVPGVVSASATCCVPLEGGYGLPFIIVGRPLEQGPFHGGGAWLTISPGYFEVFRIPILRGRAFTDRDTSTSPPVVVINEAMAHQFWPTGDPLNDRLIIGRGIMREFATEPERQIIGIVHDVRDGGLENDPQPHMYVPQAQVPDAVTALNVRITPIAWVVRTVTAPAASSAPIQAALREATGLPVSDVRTMEDVVRRSTSRQAFNMWLMSVFGAAALLLAAIGLYGLMAYSVEQRTQEIGIRLALGADAHGVRRMVVRQGLRLAIIGIVVGLACAFGLTRFISSMLYGVRAWDPTVFVGVPIVLTIVAFLAAWIPARRASRVDPIQALRYE
jgi:predicted permease